MQAISGFRISEATCLGFIRRLHDALEAREQASIKRLLTRPALHADETGMRVDGQNHWLHIVTDGFLTLKFLHPLNSSTSIPSPDSSMFERSDEPVFAAHDVRRGIGSSSGSPEAACDITDNAIQRRRAYQPAS